MGVLKWAREHGCPWDERTCEFSALDGHLGVLQWARENGCPWDKWTCTNAASNGHLRILQWARKNGCPWNEREKVNYQQKTTHPLCNYSALKWLRDKDGLYAASDAQQWIGTIDSTLDELLIPDISNLIKQYC
jgi:hypothetical protein